MFRRDLLRVDVAGRRGSIRPPWALAEELFTAQCDQCGECLRVCPEHILVRGGAGFPRVDFAAGSCSFCGECVNACKPRALAFGEDVNDPPWRVVAMISEGCLSRQGVVCRSCAETCPEGAVRFRLRPGGRSDPLVDGEACSGCGACFRVCPVGVISLRQSSDEEAQ